jgi:hypothetical protein
MVLVLQPRQQMMHAHQHKWLVLAFLLVVLQGCTRKPTENKEAEEKLHPGREGHALREGL